LLAFAQLAGLNTLSVQTDDCSATVVHVAGFKSVVSHILIMFAVVNDCVNEFNAINFNLRKNADVALVLLDARYILGEPSVPYTP